jgi:hypothetical protein
MKPIISGVLASLAVLGLATACSDDSKPSTSGATANTAVTGGSGATGNSGGSTPSGGSTQPTISLPPGVTFPSVVITLPPGVTLPTVPPGFTVPPGGTFPPDMTIPAQVIDVMIAQLEAAGMKVDRACVQNLLDDSAFRAVVMSGSTPSAEMIQGLIACFRA